MIYHKDVMNKTFQKKSNQKHKLSRSKRIYKMVDEKQQKKRKISKVN